jgi:hypothetical protein
MKKIVSFLTVMVLLQQSFWAQNTQNKFANMLYPVLNEFKLGFIDATGKLVVDYIYEVKQRDDIQQMEDGFIPFRKNKKWGFLNARGVEIIAAQYDIVSSFKNGYCLVGKLKPNETNPKIGSLYGVIDKTGVEVIPLKYDEAEFSMLSNSDYFIAKQGKKFGFVDIKTGNESGFKFSALSHFENGFAPAKDAESRKWGLVNVKGEWTADPNFDFVAHVGLNKIFQVSGPDGQWTLGNEIGQPAAEIYSYKRVQGATNFAYYSSGRLVVIDGSKYGYVDDTLGVIIPFKYADASNFYNDVAIVNEGGTKVRGSNLVNGGSWKLIDRSGDIVMELKDVEEYQEFSEGLAAVKVKGLWGFMNEKGVITIKPQWKEAPKPFKNGLAMVSNFPNWSTKFGYINLQGKVIKATE